MRSVEDIIYSAHEGAEIKKEGNTVIKSYENIEMGKYESDIGNKLNSLNSINYVKLLSSYEKDRKWYNVFFRRMN